MIKTTETLESVKEQIKSLHQKSVKVTLNLGRNKFITFLARLENVYPALFTVSPVDKSFRGKTSYSYSEYMCGKVKIKEESERVPN